MGYKVCSSHKIEARDLYNLVLKDIQDLADLAMKDADGFHKRLSGSRPTVRRLTICF